MREESPQRRILRETDVGAHFVVGGASRDREPAVEELRDTDFLLRKLFREDHPDWSIETELISVTEVSAYARATIRDEHGIRYMNCGDWVESCTALAEHEDGRFEIITWTDPLRRVAPVAAVAARAA